MCHDVDLFILVSSLLPSPLTFICHGLTKLCAVDNLVHFQVLMFLFNPDFKYTIFLSWRKMFSSHCRRERQLSFSNNEESPGNHEVLNFSTSGAGQLTVHKGKCLGKQN